MSNSVIKIRSTTPFISQAAVFVKLDVLRDVAPCVGCLADKFDSCNNQLSPVHTVLGQNGRGKNGTDKMVPIE